MILAILALLLSGHCNRGLTQAPAPLEQARITQTIVALPRLPPAAMDYLGNKGYDPAFGARPVKRVVQQELETALAKGEPS